MGNAIVDMVLGLVLLYLLLAILVSKLQEIGDGQIRGGRAMVMHRMLLEAVGRNAGLKDRVLMNPAVFALYEGEAKPQESRKNWTFGAASGPSNIPADVFARALLVELHADGNGGHPSARFNTPREFLADKSPAAAPSTDTGRIWATLRGLLAGRETSWAGFEAAIARYYSDIGDRADGWFKRRSAKWSWWLALAVALVLNVDTVHVAERLSSDADLRGGLAGLARQVDALFPAGQEAPKDKAQAALAEIAPPEPPLDRADRLLKDATLRIGRVFWRDNEVAGTKLDKWLLTASKGATAGDLVHKCGTSLSLEQPAPRNPAAGALAAPEFISNPGTWVLLLPALQFAVQATALRGDETLPAEVHSASRRGSLSDVHDCLGLLAGQVRTVAAARGDTSQEGADLVAAADALDRARLAIREQVAGGQQRLPVARLFQRDPELLIECVNAGARSQQALRRCVDAGAAGVLRLPVFFTADNRRQQFCRPLPLDRAGSAGGWLDDWFCGDDDKRRLQAQPALGIVDGVQLVGPDAATLGFWLLGCALTALFVALGAPFWFDALSKVSKLRAAGGVRQPDPAAATVVFAPGTDPKSGADAARPEPFALARNLTEKAMTPPDIVALQRALGVAATGNWDKPTRQAIAMRAQQEGFSTGEEISLLLYERIVGRSIVAAVLPRVDGSLVLREPHPLAETLAKQLCVLLGFGVAQRFAGGSVPMVFDDDLRALALLYRIKAQPGVSIFQTTAVSLASANRAALDTLDLALANEMIAACIAALAAGGPPPPQFARSSAAPWLDWALGELGQIEKNEADAAKSNPRIVQYHRAGGAPNTGDNEPWCAAFVTWVLERARAELPTIPAAPASPRLARSWVSWGGQVPPAAAAGAPMVAATPAGSVTGALPGDLVCLRMDGDLTQAADHIAVVIDVDSSGVWAVGGNEGGQGQVKVSRYGARQVLALRRP